MQNALQPPISSCLHEPAVSCVLTGTPFCSQSSFPLPRFGPHQKVLGVFCSSMLIQEEKGLWEFCRCNNNNPAGWPHPNTKTTSFHSFPRLLLLLLLTHFYKTHNYLCTEQDRPVCKNYCRRSNVSQFNLERSKWQVIIN